MAQAPADDGRPGMVVVGSVSAGGWELKIARDGSGALLFGAADMTFFPPGTFSFEEVCAKLKLIGTPEPDGKSIPYAHDDFEFSYGEKFKVFYVGKKDTAYFGQLFKQAIANCLMEKSRFEDIARKMPFIRK